MTPRTNSIIESLTSTPGQLASRRIDPSDRFFGFEVLESLRAWSRGSDPRLLLAVYAVKRGYLVGVLRFGEAPRLARYSLHRASTEAELDQLIRHLGTYGEIAGVCASETIRTQIIDQTIETETISSRSSAELSLFRRKSLRREDLFDQGFRQSLLDDAFDLGGLCSEQAVEITYADLMTLILSGPDVTVSH